MSSVRTQVEQDAEPENEWTIMVFFAGDPHLSPSMTAQLKSLKDAGFQDNTTVLVHYDPNEKGVATTTFAINQKRKEDLRKDLKEKNINEPATRIGDGKDPFVRNLLEDSINGASRRDTAEKALRAFLDIGARDYPAKHYIVSLVGHGVIVGNDAFLPDHNPEESAITLEQLGDIMGDFKRSLPKDAEFELIGMHSCSMSAIEVAYQLRGTARYMMATEGVSFVTSWPYRQIMKKILNAIDETTKDGTQVNVDKLITSVHSLALHNSTDFIFSGLSADLCLCRLDKDRIEALNAPMERLTKALKRGLEDPPKDPRWPEPPKESRGLELIKLAHLEAQSYWQETYTDLYDFCLCLERRCDKNDPVQAEMKVACNGVMRELKETGSLIVHSDHFGPLFQYSHGLSIFFPWSRPLPEDPGGMHDDILTRYKNYEFTRAFRTDSWLTFLEEYFLKTLRKSREKEDNPEIDEEETTTTITANAGSNGSSNGSRVDALDQEVRKASPALEKGSPALIDAGGCVCSIKNYPRKFSPSPRLTEDANPDATRKFWESWDFARSRR